jgi:hypothetical protein
VAELTRVKTCHVRVRFGLIGIRMHVGEEPAYVAMSMGWSALLLQG